MVVLLTLFRIVLGVDQVIGYYKLQSSAPIKSRIWTITNSPSFSSSKPPVGAPVGELRWETSGGSPGGRGPVGDLRWVAKELLLCLLLSLLRRQVVIETLSLSLRLYAQPHFTGMVNLQRVCSLTMPSLAMNDLPLLLHSGMNKQA
jgi:hypothetical protein